MLGASSSLSLISLLGWELDSPDVWRKLLSGTVWLPFYGASELRAPATHSAHGLNMSVFNTDAGEGLPCRATETPGWWAFNLINQYSDLNFRQINAEVRAKALEMDREAVKAIEDAFFLALWWDFWIVARQESVENEVCKGFSRCLEIDLGVDVCPARTGKLRARRRSGLRSPMPSLCRRWMRLGRGCRKRLRMEVRQWEKHFGPCQLLRVEHSEAFRWSLGVVAAGMASHRKVWPSSDHLQRVLHAGGHSVGWQLVRW